MSPRSANMVGMDDASVESIDLDPDLVDLAIGLGKGIVVLPLEIVDGQGVYSEPSVMLVKQLRSLGADAAYAHPSEQRVFEVKKSAEALLVAFVIGIASNAAWELMKSFLARWKDARLSVTFVELEEEDGRHGTAWKVDGDADAVIRAIDSLRSRPTSAKEGESRESGE